MVFFGTIPRLYEMEFGQIKRFSSSLPVVARHTLPALLSPGSIAIFLLVFLFSTGIKLMQKWLEAEKRTKQIENEKLHAELAF